MPSISTSTAYSCPGARTHIRVFDTQGGLPGQVLFTWVGNSGLRIELGAFEVDITENQNDYWLEPSLFELVPDYATDPGVIFASGNGWDDSVPLIRATIEGTIIERQPIDGAQYDGGDSRVLSSRRVFLFEEDNTAFHTWESQSLYDPDVRDNVFWFQSGDPDGFRPQSAMGVAGNEHQFFIVKNTPQGWRYQASNKFQYIRVPKPATFIVAPPINGIGDELTFRDAAPVWGEGPYTAKWYVNSSEQKAETVQNSRDFSTFDYTVTLETSGSDIMTVWTDADGVEYVSERTTITVPYEAPPAEPVPVRLSVTPKEGSVWDSTQVFVDPNLKEITVNPPALVDVGTIRVLEVDEPGEDPVDEPGGEIQVFSSVAINTSETNYFEGTYEQPIEYRCNSLSDFLTKYDSLIPESERVGLMFETIPSVYVPIGANGGLYLPDGDTEDANILTKDGRRTEFYVDTRVFGLGDDYDPRLGWWEPGEEPHEPFGSGGCFLISSGRSPAGQQSPQKCNGAVVVNKVASATPWWGSMLKDQPNHRGFAASDNGSFPSYEIWQCHQYDSGSDSKFISNVDPESLEIDYQWGGEARITAFRVSEIDMIDSGNFPSRVTVSGGNIDGEQDVAVVNGVVNLQDGNIKLSSGSKFIGKDLKLSKWQTRKSENPDGYDNPDKNLYVEFNSPEFFYARKESPDAFQYVATSAPKSRWYNVGEGEKSGDEGAEFSETVEDTVSFYAPVDVESLTGWGYYQFAYIPGTYFAQKGAYRQERCNPGDCWDDGNYSQPYFFPINVSDADAELADWPLFTSFAAKSDPWDVKGWIREEGGQKIMRLGSRSRIEIKGCTGDLNLQPYVIRHNLIDDQTTDIVVDNEWFNAWFTVKWSHSVSQSYGSIRAPTTFPDGVCRDVGLNAHAITEGLSISLYRNGSLFHSESWSLGSQKNASHSSFNVGPKTSTDLIRRPIYYGPGPGGVLAIKRGLPPSGDYRKAIETELQAVI